jgi:hypothetical protein
MSLSLTRNRGSRSRSPLRQTGPSSAGTSAWVPRTSEFFNSFDQPAPTRTTQLASESDESATQAASEDDRWALASAALDLHPSQVQDHAALVEAALQDAAPRADDVYCKHWHPSLATLSVSQLRDAWRVADYLMMDAKPLAEDAAQRVMRGFVADVDALGLTDEHRKEVVALLVPPPQHYSARKMKLARGKVAPKTAAEMAIAARWGQLSAIQRARSAGCRWNSHLCSEAAEGGHLELLQWVRSQPDPCPWDEHTCRNAAGDGQLEVLQWAHENGCPWDAHTCARAAWGGHLDVLQWLRSQGCPWDEWTCKAAAQDGHLAVLQWARSQGCPWNWDTCAAAAGDGHLTVLQWARSQGCPWDEETWRVTRPDQVIIRDWLRANGCPGARG